MKILFYFVTFLVLVHSKEKLSGLEKYMDDPTFWQYVVKRLDGGENSAKSKVPEEGANESPSKSKDQYIPVETHSDTDISNTNGERDKSLADSMEDTLGNLCQYRPNASLIIRSKASINNGAFFLKSFNEKTREECVNACCYTQGCNLVVYENKDKHNCYLFNCGSPSKCLFAEHANYTAMFFPNHVAPGTSFSGHQQQHENELEGLNSKVTPKPATLAPKRKVPLYGKCDIDWNDECSDRNAECRDNICKCSYGYHAKYGICRLNCPDSEFECENRGQGVNVPECISRNHVCDGQPQCADGSDESMCSHSVSAMTTTSTTTTTTTTTTTAKPTTLKTAQQVINSQGVNNQILPQYFPNHPNRVPVGSDMYNGNAYYWPSGYNRMYGTQSFPGNYGRYQGGVQYPYDPRLYGNGRQIGTGNGYIEPVRDYYDKIDSGSGGHDSISQADLGLEISKGSKPGHTGVKYPKVKVVPVSEGRDGAPVHKDKPASVQQDTKFVAITTRPPTTVQPIIQLVSTKENLNKWEVPTHQAGWKQTNQQQQTAWKSDSDDSSEKQYQGNIPSWKSNGRAQSPPEINRNNHVDKTEQKSEENVSEQQTSTKSVSSSKVENKGMPLSKQDSDHQRHWKQHTESHMGSTNSETKTEVKGSQDDRNLGRISSGFQGQGNAEKDENHGRKNSQDQGQGQSGRLPVHQEKGWKDDRNDGAEQTSNTHGEQENRMETGVLGRGRGRGRTKGRPGSGYHRIPSQPDRGLNRAGDTSGKPLEQKQKGTAQSTDYDSYLERNPQREKSYGVKKPGNRRPAYKKQRPHNYQYYDSYKPYSYWNYDYYNYDDQPNKKYPATFDQGDSDNGIEWKEKNTDQGDKVIKQKTPKPPTLSPTPRPTTQPKTTIAPAVTAKKTKDPGQITEGNSSGKEDHPKLPTKTGQASTADKNSTAEKMADASGLLEEAVETHVVVESPTDSHQGPIVALGLGLGITVILLFFVGCRLRNVKRRIRKGRALHSNEADYLINGMYL